MVQAVPDGFNTVSAHIVVKGAAQAMEFYAKAFGAEPIMAMPGPGGLLMHGELKFGDSTLMLADENPAFPGCNAPAAPGASPVKLHLYVDDCDALFARAVAAGATPAMPPADMFWGDRYCSVICPYGHTWNLATHKEDLTPEEIGKRAGEFFSNPGCGN